MYEFREESWFEQHLHHGMIFKAIGQQSTAGRAVVSPFSVNAMQIDILEPY